MIVADGWKVYQDQADLDLTRRLDCGNEPKILSATFKSAKSAAFATICFADRHNRGLVAVESRKFSGSPWS